MAQFEYFEDIHDLIREQSCVAELVAMEAMKLTERVTGQKNVIDGSLLQTLTSLVTSKLDIDEIKIEYKQREQQRAVVCQIDAALSVQRK